VNPDSVAHVALTRSELAELANTFFTMVSALAAVAAVGMLVAGRKTDRRQYQFRRLVLDIALEAVPRFTTEVSGILEAGKHDLLTLDPSLIPHSAIVDKTRTLTEQFNTRFYELRQTLRNAAISWGDPELSAAVDEALQALQDAVTPAIASLASDPKPPPGFAVIVGENGARVLQSIVGHDQ
jgi:hypothetical protein